MKHLILTLFLCAPLAAQDGTAEMVETLLVELDAHGDPELAAAGLTALGPRAVPALLHSLSTAQGKRAEGIERALAASSPDAVAMAVGASLDASGDEAVRRAALRALGAAGRASETGLCVRAATLEHGALSAELQRALAAMLERGVQPFAELEREWPHLVPELCTAAARGCGDAGGSAALTFLAGLLDRSEASPGLLLSQMGRAASLGVEREVAVAVAQRVRPFLLEDEEGIRKSAAILVGRLEDPESVPVLIALLGSDSGAVRANAHWSLKRITALSLPPDDEAWGAWQRRESSWWSRRAAQAFSGLRAREAALAAESIKEVSEHRLDRHRVARELAGALAHPSVEVRQLACETLGRVGTQEAVPELVAALEDPLPAVRASALAALQALTGTRLGPDPHVWQESVAALER